ncbi:MAG: transcriptional repressor LexA [Acidobacteriota bacterium]|nr:transcriptional repressor LexA [Acidobacteriota bacterium]
MQPRTRRQREILDFITEFIEERGHIPSYQQIARKFKIASKSAVAKHIAAMEKQGILQRRREDGSFGLALRAENLVNEAVCEVEWLEITGADSGDGFSENWEQEPLFVPKFLLGYYDPERIRAFRVPNDSMLDEHICEGDIALIEKRSFARDGAIVVAKAEARVVLKRFYRSGANVELRPANRNYETLRLAADKVSVHGVLHGLLRPLS